MKALMVEPNKKPYMVEIDNTLKDLQDAVGGMIQEIYPWNDSVALICNEEGKIDGLPLNRALRDEDGNIYDVIAGDFLIAGINTEDFTDLSDNLIQKYTELFESPENIYEIINALY